MTFTKPNRSPATFTRNRVEPAPISGICVTCLDGCPGPCEVGRSALRGREILYPQPLSKVTAGAEKIIPLIIPISIFRGPVWAQSASQPIPIAQPSRP